MLLTYHIKELQFRAFYLFLAWSSFFFLSYLHSFSLFSFCFQPISSYVDFLILTHPLELFWSSLFLSGVISSFLSLPLFFLHLLGFFSSALYLYERSFFLRLFFKYGLLLFSETFFLLKFLLPFFLVTQVLYGQDLLEVHLELRVSSYLGFYVKGFLLWLFCFTFPFLLFDLHLSPQVFVKGRYLYSSFVLILLSFWVTNDLQFFSCFSPIWLELRESKISSADLWFPSRSPCLHGEFETAPNLRFW
jgi:Sec-independent protein secretion pathway component TatC